MQSPEHRVHVYDAQSGDTCLSVKLYRDVRVERVFCQVLRNREVVVLDQRIVVCGRGVNP